MQFPENFIWGGAAASYQIEGAANEEGRGPSVWDMLCRRPDAILEGHTGDVGCDHYHRMEEDVQLMAEIGLRAYRLSISWSRVLPDGTGAVNPAGMDFYERLIDTLLANGIAPWVTLFHWDYPLALYHQGGWLNRDSANWFADYAQLITERLSDRVTCWMTQNEPQCYIGLGHQSGIHAPGDKLNITQVLRAAHHSMLGHGRAVQAMRAVAKRPLKIGAAPVGMIRIPATESAADIAAARASMFAVTAPNVWNNTWFCDPILLGKYPKDGLELFAGDLPEMHDGDLKEIHQPLDFCGINIYNGEYTRAGADGQPEAIPWAAGRALTAMDWPVTPEALYWGPKFFHDRYNLPIAITENGMANCDWVQRDGCVHDPQRIDFLNGYLSEYRRAIHDGIDGIAYFLWSIMDNFEWGFGYNRRFGIIHIDYDTRKRTLKDSAHWYRQVIAENGANLD